MLHDNPQVLIYVQHLLGVGHYSRSVVLANALAESGFRVELVSGGTPQAAELNGGVHLTQLPPVRCVDSSFTQLVDDHDEPIDARWKQNRARLLRNLSASIAPDILITETFPFGRRMMRFELLPLLDDLRKASRPVLVISSIRDILQPKSKPGRNREIIDLLSQYYDQVIVHGDEAVAPLAESFTLAKMIADKTIYSGYICRPRIRNSARGAGEDEVLVSAGGSDTGLGLLATAIAAKPLTRLTHLHWRILVSPAIDAEKLQRLQCFADDTMTIERNREDFPERLRCARLTISQAGYNTVSDILSSPTPAVLVPFAEADEIEQTIRARQLHKSGRVVMVEPQLLSADTLAQAIDQASYMAPIKPPNNLDGANQSASIIRSLLKQTRSNR